MKKDKNVYTRLFTSIFYLSAFTFGGGYVIVPLMKKKFVEDLKLIDEEEMINMVAIGQSSPGAIAVNTALLIGYKTAGFAGAAVSVTAAILPPFITISVVSFFYASFKDNTVVATVLRGMQAGVAAVILNAVFDFGADTLKDKSVISILIMIAAFVLSYFLKINVIYIILFCIILGVVKGNRK